MTSSANEQVAGSVVEEIISGSEPKLWAGKYKTPEALEEAYKNSSKVFNENSELKKQLETVTKAPDDYTVPEGVGLKEHELKEIKQIAKEAGLNQEHFAKMAKQMDAKIVLSKKSLEDAKTSLGEEKLNVLTDYVKKNYPETLHDTVLTKLIKDPNAMSDALKDRDKRLNSSVPGMGKASGSGPDKYDGETELVKAANEYKKNKTPLNKQKYIKLAAEVGNARYGNQK